MRGACVVGLLFVTVALAACGDKPKTPEGAVRALVAAARAGDRAGVYRRLGPQTRAQIEAIAAEARRSSGRVAPRPEDFLSVGWAPPSWEPAAFRTLTEDDAHATVEVASAAGDRHAVTLVRDREGWALELPVP